MRSLELVLTATIVAATSAATDGGVNDHDHALFVFVLIFLYVFFSCQYCRNEI